MQAKIHLRKSKSSPTFRRRYIAFLSCLIVLQLFIMPLGFTPVAPTGVSAQKSVETPTAIIYDNAPLATGPTSRSGVPAPAGSNWSEVGHDFSSTTATNTTIGFGCQRIGVATSNRCADDFNVPVGQVWTINSVITFAYQTGFAGPASPFVDANVQIWSGRPGSPGATVVAGNSTSLPFTSTDILVYRTSNSGPPLNTVPGTTRRVWQNTISLTSPAVLSAGNYWVDFQLDTGATTGNFAPPATITGVRSVPGWNGRQFIGPPTNTGWADALDAGNPAAEPDLAQDFPFKLDGSVAFAPDAPPTSRRMDFDGDNKSDGVVARAAGAAAQSTWFISRSSGGSSAVDFGLGIGFAGGDIATPEDFDGDGKTDIAVWRSHPTAANFYILQSSNGALRTEQFGKAGDDPSVVDDYDGDGKADVAVFRSTVTGIDPCGAGTVWYWRPSGTPATNFRYSCFGLPGDKPYPGDFDGDGKADPSVVRNNGGVGDIYQSRTTAGPRNISFGNFTDRYISGDFDGDGRADLAVARDSAGSTVWYFTASGNGLSFSFTLGASATDFIVPGDYDGDNKTDFALWRSGAGAGSGDFYLLKTFTSPVEFKWGSSGANLTAPDYPVGTYQVH
jgi:hypothetical protein